MEALGDTCAAWSRIAVNLLIGTEKYFWTVADNLTSQELNH